jgi:hypothetical protein
MTWDQELAECRKAALLAIRETSDLLLSNRVSPRWRSELEGQVEQLRNYVSVIDLFTAERRGSSIH